MDPHANNPEISTFPDGRRKRVLVAMSGGVDSSVCAALLKQQGYDVIGVHLLLWNQADKNEERFGGRCCSLTDSNDARRVCDRLDIPYFQIDAQEIFNAKVVDYFVHEYLEQRTPNPCVECNNQIKFSYLFQKADELGCDLVATGHYTRLRHDPGTGVAHLHRAVDPGKDQSYFLFGLTQKALRRTLMPLGGFTKLQVRKLAVSFDLPVAEKADSQEICFIGQEGYSKFIESRTSTELRPEGVMMDLQGHVLGQHEGLHRFTIGQRRGLGLQQKEGEELLYVVGFQRDQNTLLLGTEKDLLRSELVAHKLNWLQPLDGLRTFACVAKIRSQHEGAECAVTPYENGEAVITFKQPQRAITPGQAIVFYSGDEVLGGGFIHQARIQ